MGNLMEKSTAERIMPAVHEEIKDNKHGKTCWIDVYVRHGKEDYKSMKSFRSCYVRWRTARSDVNKTTCAACKIDTFKRSQLFKFRKKYYCRECLMEIDKCEYKPSPLRSSLNRMMSANCAICMLFLFMFIVTACDPKYGECKPQEVECQDNKVATCGEDEQWYYVDCNAYDLKCCYVKQDGGISIDGLTCTLEEQCQNTK